MNDQAAKPVTHLVFETVTHRAQNDVGQLEKHQLGNEFINFLVDNLTNEGVEL